MKLKCSRWFHASPQHRGGRATTGPWKRLASPASRSQVRRAGIARCTVVWIAAALMGVAGWLAGRAEACPFCSAVSQTLRQEMQTMDAVVIATSIQDDRLRDPDSGEVEMRVEKVLKGDAIEPQQVVTAIYYGQVKPGRRFLLSGVLAGEMQWSCLPVSGPAEDYIVRVSKLPEDDGAARLRFFQEYLDHDDPMLSRDAYDEFASAPYSDVQAIRDSMDHDQLVQWIQQPDLSPDRKRLYLTMLGVCGSEEDVPMLAEMLRSTQKSSRSGLDALIACYLTLAGESGLDLVDKLFLANQQSSYADAYAAIMAIRFHGTEGGVIARSALVESLHHILDREDLADLVIPDLARWQDWSQVDKVKELFLTSDAENNWIRVPAVNYLQACPLPEADEAIEELEKVDPASVRRANTFFSIPKPADPGRAETSSIGIPSAGDVAVGGRMKPTESGPTPVGPTTGRPTTGSLKPVRSIAGVLPTGGVRSDGRTASIGRIASTGLASRAGTAGFPSVSNPQSANPLRLVGVVATSLATLVIGLWLILSGGQPAADSVIVLAAPNVR